MAPKRSSNRIERDAGSEKFVKTGTEHPKTTVTEPRTRNKPNKPMKR